MPVLEERVFVSVSKILLATDFSSAAAKAAGYARALARRYRASVEVAHVFDPAVVMTYEEAVIGLPAAERREWADHELKQLQEEFTGAGISAQAVLVESHRAGEGVLKVAVDDGVDLIVAGTESKRGVERLLLGSTAEKLIRGANCPVLTVGPKAREASDGPLRFERILYVTDFSPEAARAAVYALSFAEDSGAHLTLCYVFDEEREEEGVRGVLNMGFRAALEKLIPETGYDWCSPECVVEHGVAAEAILGLAKRMKADLIVLGARKSSFWLTHVERGLTPDLLAEASCPIMTIS